MTGSGPEKNEYNPAKWEQTVELLRTVAASESRLSIIDVINNENIQKTFEIAEAAGVSPSAVSQLKNDLRNSGLLVENEVELSSMGKIVAGHLEETRRIAESINHLKPFLEDVSHFGALDIEEIIPELIDCEVIDDIHGMEGRVAYREFIRSSNHIRELVPFPLGEGPTFLDQFENDSLTGEFVLDTDLDTSVSEPVISESIHAAGGEMHVSKLPFPDFTLSISDQGVLFITTNVRTVVRCDDDRVREWAEGEYRRYLETSHPLFEADT